ncbi:MAG: aminotransferase [Pseudomonadota bacterium]
MHIEPFGVEIWMNEWETKCALNLAETCVESMTIGQLLQLVGQGEGALNPLLDMKMTYGAIEGSERLREAIAGLYTSQQARNVVITHGTIGANMLVHRALVEAGDRVIAVVPTYQQHYSIPASLGAEVHHLWLREADRWLPDLDRLGELAAPGARLIALTNPNNPTGALIPREMLEEIAAIARKAGAWVLCDEVYRGTDQEGEGATASMADLYERGISTGGMSKAFSLAGLRLGWVTAPSQVLEAVMIHRDYDTISVSMIDDYFATLAVEHHAQVLGRSRAITRGNLAVLADWLDGQASLSWVRPSSGTTALVKVDTDKSSRDFCIELLEDTGVMLTPGSALAMEGYLRFGYANGQQILREGLERLSGFLART